MQATTVDELRVGGTVLPITRWGNPVMHARTRAITEFDAALVQLVRNMFATMYAAEGVGLAATQVGVDLGRCSSSTARTTTRCAMSAWCAIRR